MDPFLRSVQDCFRRHGIEAVLDPDGVSRPVRLLPVQPDDVSGIGDLRVQSATGVFEILASAFSGHGAGAVLDLGVERRRVQHMRVRDSRRFKVTLDTVEVPG